MLRIIYIVLFLTIQAKAQRVVLFDSLTNKYVRVREGKLLGVITAKDTIDPYTYRDSTYQNDVWGYRPDGIWKLHKVDVTNEAIQLKPRGRNVVLMYPIKEIKYFQYRKEKDSRYRESLFWVGTVGCTLGGIASLFDPGTSIGYSLGFLSVSAISTAWVFGTRNRVELKKYTLIRLENK